MKPWRKEDQIDTTLNIHPDDFKMRLNIVETMSLKELDEFIKKQLMQGETNIMPTRSNGITGLPFLLLPSFLHLLGWLSHQGR